MFRNLATRNSMMTLRTSGPPPTPIVNLTISADTMEYNLFTAAGSPIVDTIVNLTINGTGGAVSGAGGKIVVGSTNSLYPGLVVSGFTTGSTINIINNGYIVGHGGAGGEGGEITWSNGGNGGAAISLGNNVNIDNTNGYIYGGGGGGGSNTTYDFDYANGGGGQGYFGGTVTSYNGNTAGIFTAIGNRGTYGAIEVYYSGYGGSWGSAGTNGSFDDNGTVAGSGGNAIILNGKSVTWLGGNNGSQVKGAVS